MNVNDFLGGEHLRRDDVPEPKLLTVTQVSTKRFDDSSETKLVLHFQELDRSLVMNKTNLQIAKTVFATSETDEWIGKQIVVYDDESIFFQGKQTGGLRLRAPNKVAEGTPF